MSTAELHLRVARRQPEHPAMLGLVTLLALAAVIQAAVTLFNFSGPPRQMELLRLLPEASLLYPGSEVIAHGGRDAAMTMDGPLSASSWQYVGVNASPEEIEAWYAAELEARGWAEGGSSSGIRAVGELVAVAWNKDGVIFRLGIRDPEYWGADPKMFAQYESIYDAALLGDRRDQD